METEQRPLQFSLRDLFVGTAVVATAFALLPPLLLSLRSGRNGSCDRDSTCRNNMRNLALTIIQYEAARDRYPGYNNDLDPTTTGLPDNDRSWTFVLLPYLDQRSLYEELRSKQTPNPYNSLGNLVAGGIATRLEIAICPSSPPEASVAALTSYVVNTGQFDAPATAARPADFPQNGVFHTGIRASPDHALTIMTAKYIAAHDGLSTTLLMAENADARAWCDTTERWTGFTWHTADGQPGPPDDNPKQPLGINVLFGRGWASQQPNSAPGFARPSSHHPGGFNVAFCDGSVRFINDTISYGVYQALMTPRGAGAVDNSDPAAAPLPTGHAAREPVDKSDVK